MLMSLMLHVFDQTCSRKNTGTSIGEKRTSRFMPTFSLRRHGSRGGGRVEGDRVRLVEGEEGEVGEEWGEGGGGEETAGQREVMSESEIQNVKVGDERAYVVFTMN